MQLQSNFQPVSARRARDLLGVSFATNTVAQRFPLKLDTVDNAAVVTYGTDAYGGQTCTVTGVDNADAINAHDVLCAALGLTAYLPPGSFVCRKQVVLTANWVMDGTLYFPNDNGGRNANGSYPVPTRPAQKVWIGGGDRTAIPKSEWSTWTGTTKGSSFIGGKLTGGVRSGGLRNRVGQYITVDTNDQNILQRSKINGVVRDPLNLTEGFIVADNEGRIAHPLFINWTNETWTTADVFAERLKAPITIEGLKVVIFDNGGTETVESAVYVNRSNVTFKNDMVVNMSGRPVAQLHNSNRVANLTYDGSYVNGAQVVGTNYGFNGGGNVNVTFRKVTALYCRRSIENHKNKNVLVDVSLLGDGFGGHWVVDTVVSASVVSAGNSTLAPPYGGNAQAFQCAGSNITIRGCTINLHGARTWDEELSCFTCRGDGFEMDGFVIIEGCNINWSATPPENMESTDKVPKEYVLFRAQSANGTYDPGRRVTLPKQVVIRNNNLTVSDVTKGLQVVKWLGNYTDESFPQIIETGTYIDVDNNTIQYVDPSTGSVLSHLDASGNPKTTVFLNKTWNLRAAPRLRVRRMPSFGIDALTGVYQQRVPEEDGNGNPVRDGNGNIVYQTVKNADGAVKLDGNGNPVYVYRTNTDAHSKVSRWWIDLEDIAGDVRVRWTPGSISAVMAKCGGVLNVSRYPQNTGLAAFGDEQFERVGAARSAPVFNDGSLAGFLMTNGKPFRVQDVAGMVNYLRLSGGATGDAPVLHALGPNSHIPIEFVPKGSAPVLMPKVELTGLGSTGDLSGMTVTPAAGAGNTLANRVVGDWAAYTPTLAATGGSGVTLSGTVRYLQNAKTLTIKGTVRVLYTTAPTGVSITLPTGLDASGDNVGGGSNISGGFRVQAVVRNGGPIALYSLGAGNVLVSGSDQYIAFTIDIELQ